LATACGIFTRQPGIFPRWQNIIGAAHLLLYQAPFALRAEKSSRRWSWPIRRGSLAIPLLTD